MSALANTRSPSQKILSQKLLASPHKRSSLPSPLGRSSRLSSGGGGDGVGGVGATKDDHPHDEVIILPSSSAPDGPSSNNKDINGNNNKEGSTVTPNVELRSCLKSCYISPEQQRVNSMLEKRKEHARQYIPIMKKGAVMCKVSQG